MSRIWELNIAANQHLAIQTGDLRYFWDHFNGQPMSRTWSTPDYDVLNRSKKVADFTSWQIGSQAFLASARAKEMILQLDQAAVEFLPFGSFKGRELFAVNVLRTEDFLDMERTEFMSGAGGTPVRVVWRDQMPEQVPPIFKIRGSSNTYVSELFGRKAVELAMTGLRLADPKKNRFEQIVRGEQINEFPGL